MVVVGTCKKPAVVGWMNEHANPLMNIGWITLKIFLHVHVHKKDVSSAEKNIILFCKGFLIGFLTGIL
jgi:hypothetical protein